MAIVVGRSACPTGGKVHTWPSRSSNASHTFGAGAIDGVVYFFADVRGKRTGTIRYTYADWDELMRRIAETGPEVNAEDYVEVDRSIISRIFRHAPLNTTVEFDLKAPPLEQVRIIREESDGSRMVTDSILSLRAFILAAKEGLFSTAVLEPVSRRVANHEYACSSS